MGSYYLKTALFCLYQIVHVLVLRRAENRRNPVYVMSASAKQYFFSEVSKLVSASKEQINHYTVMDDIYITVN